MATATPAHELPTGVVERVLDVPDCAPHRIEAGRRRALDGPAEPGAIADAVVAEGPPLLQRPAE